MIPTQHVTQFHILWLTDKTDKQQLIYNFLIVDHHIISEIIICVFCLFENEQRLNRNLINNPFFVEKLAQSRKRC